MSIIGAPIVAGGSNNKLNAASAAAAYDPTSTYDVGDFVTYKGSLYQCKVVISTAETWNAAHWDAVVLTDLQTSVSFEEMTMGEYEALSQSEKMDGTVRFITDVSTFPDASGVGF